MVDEWKAEMPEVFSVTTKGGLTGLTGHWSRSLMCEESDVRSLLTRANDELAKVRAERDAALARVRELENTLEWTQKERDALKYSAPERGPWASTATQLVHESRMRQEAESRLAEAKAEAHQLGVNLHLERQRVRELTEWRPMETAPDGWLLLAFAPDADDFIASCRGQVSVARRVGDSWTVPYYASRPPVGWLPLPEPPKEGA